MPRRNWKERIYTESDWKEADPMQQIYISLVQPDDFFLNPEQEQKLESLRKVWAILGRNLSTMRRIKRIMAETDCSRRSAFRWIEEAQWLFGDLLKTNLETELAAMKERMYVLGDKASNEGDYETAMRCYNSATAILEKIAALNPPESRQLPTIIFTSNPAVLKTGHDAETIEFEQVEARLLEREANTVLLEQAAD